jgi:hypothetical protein
VAALLAAGMGARAQSSDALIDKLVEKGVLSVKEANELRVEIDKNFTAAYSVQSGMPEWVASFKWGGDLFGRFEACSSSNALFERQDRWGYGFLARCAPRTGFCCAALHSNLGQVVKISLRAAGDDTISHPWPVKLPDIFAS